MTAVLPLASARAFARNAQSGSDLRCLATMLLGENAALPDYSRPGKVA